MDVNKEFIEKLNNVKINNLHDLENIENMCKNVDDIKIVEPLFHVFENNPDFNFGNPGNLVRIIEKYYTNPSYEQELYKSVERKPTEYNLWMLNRLLNTFDENKKGKGIELLERIVSDPNISEQLKDSAKDFLEEQTE